MDFQIVRGRSQRTSPLFLRFLTPPLPPCHPRSLFADPPIKRMSLFADPPLPSFSVFFSATWAIWCSFRREFQAKLDFEMLCTLGIETKELSFFFYWKNRVFFHIQRGRPFFMTPSPPLRHLMSSFCKPPPPPHMGDVLCERPLRISAIIYHPS